MYKDTIEKMHELQMSRISAITLTNPNTGNGKPRLMLEGGPATKQHGLYWIYTNHSNGDLMDATSSESKGAVPLALRTASHDLLSYVCTAKKEHFKVVYNGIGGRGGGLRERILGEFRQAKGTGSLQVLGSSLRELRNWRYSWVLWSEIQFNHPHEFSKHAVMIERLWRIHYGWPILCEK